MGRKLGRVWIGGVTLLIAFIAYSSQIFVIWPWYGRTLSIELLSLLVPFNALVAILYRNYFLTVVTDPGRAPKDWKPDYDAEEGYEIKRVTNNPRYCRTCKAYKPPRAHHCSQCRKCTLRMDHHCPWVNNCVGHYNYGHFIRFLFFVDISCAYHLVMMTRRVMDAMSKTWAQQPSDREFIFIIMNYVACVPVMLMVGGFSLYHFHLLSSNTTTIESWEKDRVATLIRRGRIHEVKFPYHLGLKRNVVESLGTNPLFWCWPGVPPLGTGVGYSVGEGEDIGYAQDWPPKDPMSHQPMSMHPEDDDGHEFTLPDSPWTYGNETLNPTLRANGDRSKPRGPGHANAPPYHPDYRPPEQEEREESGDEYSETPPWGNGSDGLAKRRMRRGSEGYEVPEIDREEILRRYIASRGEEVGRYQPYVPEQHLDGSDLDTDNDDNDTMPLAGMKAVAHRG